jgi:endonuclease/exonuclease/phosphatase family metal-dependent hydrolase
MTLPLHIASYNIHKGLSHFNRRLTVHDVRDQLRQLGAEIVFLQEVQGTHDKRASVFSHWPDQPQHEFLADKVFGDFAYGKNSVYSHGHHGNAILSRYPIRRWDNVDISAHAFEARGMLHCEVDLPGLAQPLHCINVHLGLTEGGRRRQIDMISRRIHEMVPDDAPLILAGDFNDWRTRACHYMRKELRLSEVFEAHQGQPARSFPSAMPIFQLDRIYTRGFRVHNAAVHSGFPWRRYSDHAALTATLFPA